MCCTPLSYGRASGDGICQNTRQKKHTVIVNAEWKLYFSLVLSFFIFLLFILCSYIGWWSSESQVILNSLVCCLDLVGELPEF